MCGNRARPIRVPHSSHVPNPRPQGMWTRDLIEAVLVIGLASPLVNDTGALGAALALLWGVTALAAAGRRCVL